MILELNQVSKLLDSRLGIMEHYVQQGVIPGELDSIELEQMIGRIKEIKFVLALLAGKDVSNVD